MYKNKIVCITGCSSGIGAACVEVFLEKGWRVILHARNANTLQSTLNTVNITKEQIATVFADLQDPNSYQQLVKDICAPWGVPDVIIHNAGISQKSFAMDTKPSIEEQFMQVNFWAPVHISKLLIPMMKGNGGGTIACVGSIAGRFGSPYLSAYAASKHALYGYFDSLRYELKKEGIHILMVTPGFIHTNIDIKSITGDGSLSNIKSKAQEKGIPPRKVAEKIYQGVIHKKSEVRPGKLEMLFPYINTMAPGLFRQLIAKLHGM